MLPLWMTTFVPSGSARIASLAVTRFTNGSFPDPDPCVYVAGMDFDLTPEQLDIKNQVRALCSRFPDEYWRDRDASGEFPWDFYQAVADGGWLGITIPPEFGGAGLGI